MTAVAIKSSRHLMRSPYWFKFQVNGMIAQITEFDALQKVRGQNHRPESRIFVLSLVLFLLLALQLLTVGPTGNFDKIRNFASVFSQDTWQVITTFGDGRALFALLLPLSIRYRKLVWPIILAGLIGWLISRGLKYLIHMPRPAVLLNTASLSLPGEFSGSPSFPSGHTVVVFSFIGVWLTALTRLWHLPLIAFATLVGLSRIAIGAHWPTDVLAGALVGVLASYLGLWLSQIWRWGHDDRGHTTLILFMSLAVITLPFIDHGASQSFALRIFLMGIALGTVGPLYLPSVFKRGISHRPNLLRQSVGAI